MEVDDRLNLWAAERQIGTLSRRSFGKVIFYRRSKSASRFDQGLLVNDIGVAFHWRVQKGLVSDPKLYAEDWKSGHR
jgi:hypothetical protein